MAETTWLFPKPQPRVLVHKVCPSICVGLRESQKGNVAFSLWSSWNLLSPSLSPTALQQPRPHGRGGTWRIHSHSSVLNRAADLARSFPHLPICSVGTASGLDCSNMGGGGEDRKGKGVEHRSRTGREGSLDFILQAVRSHPYLFNKTETSPVAAFAGKCEHWGGWVERQELWRPGQGWECRGGPIPGAFRK